MLNKACEWKNDIYGVPNFKNVMPKFDNRRQRYLDNEEAKAVLDNIRKVDISGNWYDISLFAINTGSSAESVGNLGCR